MEKYLIIIIIIIISAIFYFYFTREKFSLKKKLYCGFKCGRNGECMFDCLYPRRILNTCVESCGRKRKDPHIMCRKYHKNSIPWKKCMNSRIKENHVVYERCKRGCYS